MLYLSRRLNMSGSVDENSFGVVNTDDDTETIMTFNQLYWEVNNNGLKVVGATPREHPFYNSKTYRPYQDPRFYTTLMTKTRALLGVDVTVWHDMITCIAGVVYPLMCGKSIRLSNYGKYVSCDTIFMFVDHPIYEPTKFIRIVLDDKLEIADNLLCWIKEGYLIDLSELSDDAFVIKLYENYLNYDHWNDPRVWDKYVFDSKQRISRYRSENH